MLWRKWKPRYFSLSNTPASPTEERMELSIQIPLSESAVLMQSSASAGGSDSMEGIEQQISTSEEGNTAKPNKKRKAKKSRQLSTKSVFRTQYLSF